VSRVVIVGCLFTLFGCAGAVSAAGNASAIDAAARAKESHPEPLALLAELPGGADRCVLAQPARVDATRRTLTARVSQAEPFAWLPALQVQAYASVERANRDGASARVSLLSIGVAPDQARAVLQAEGGVVFDFEASPTAPRCAGVGCPIRARFTASNRLWLQRGELVPVAQPGAEQLCSKLLERNPDAVEASAARGGPPAELELPLHTSAELTLTSSGLQVLRIDELPSALEADAALEDDTAGVMLGPVLAVGSNLRRERRGAALYSTYDVLWQDLEFARDDDTRAHAAEREADVLARALPDPEALPAQRQDVLGQLGYLIDQARASAEPERSGRLSAARKLLEQALARTPDDEGIALLLCELLVTELHDPEPAAQLAKRFATRPVLGTRFALLGRNAAALISADALSARLVADGVAKPRDAPLLARDIQTRMQHGTPYEAAERAALDARQ
jgi:hypothetical protein